MNLETIFLYFLLTASVVSVVLAAPIESPSGSKFSAFIDQRGTIDNDCSFPPVIQREKFASCTDNDASNSTRAICDGIMELSKLSCGISFNIPPADVIIQLKAGEIKDEYVEEICDAGYIQRALATDDKCTDVCSKGKAYYPCELYLAMLRSVYTSFSKLTTLQNVHIVIHNMKTYFPFPPHQMLDKSYPLQICEKDNNITQKTKSLCLQIADLAKQFGERNQHVLNIEMVKNITQDWDPCPVMSKKYEFPECKEVCKDVNAPVCKAIAYGLSILAKSSDSVVPDGLPKTVTTRTQDDPSVGATNSQTPGAGTGATEDNIPGAGADTTIDKLLEAGASASDGKQQGAGATEDKQLGAGTGATEDKQLGAGTDATEDKPPGTGTGATEEKPQGAGTGATMDKQLGAGTVATEDKQIGADTDAKEDKPQGAGTGLTEDKPQDASAGASDGKQQGADAGETDAKPQDASAGASDGKQQGADTGATEDKPLGAGTGATEDKPPGAGTGETEDKSLGAGTGATEDKQLGAGTDATEDKQLGAGTGETEDKQLGAGTGETEDKQLGAGTGATEDKQLGAGTGATEDKPLGAGTDATEDKQLGAGPDATEDKQLGAGPDATEDKQLGAGTGITEGKPQDASAGASDGKQQGADAGETDAKPQDAGTIDGKQGTNAGNDELNNNVNIEENLSKATVQGGSKTIPTIETKGVLIESTLAKPSEFGKDEPEINTNGDDDGLTAGQEVYSATGVDKPSKNKITDTVYSDEEAASGGMSFMSYFLVFLVLCVAGYIVFHNKQKIIALVIEGKTASNGRRPSSKDYRRLKTDDVMPSLEKSASSSNYVY